MTTTHQENEELQACREAAEDIGSKVWEYSLDLGAVDGYAIGNDVDEALADVKAQLLDVESDVYIRDSGWVQSTSRDEFINEAYQNWTDVRPYDYAGSTLVALGEVDDEGGGTERDFMLHMTSPTYSAEFSDPQLDETLSITLPDYVCYKDMAFTLVAAWLRQQFRTGKLNLIEGDYSADVFVSMFPEAMPAMQTLSLDFNIIGDRETSNYKIAFRTRHTGSWLLR